MKQLKGPTKLKIILVGTHKDKLTRKSQDIEDINKVLTYFIKTTQAYKDHLIVKGDSHIMMCVDNTSQGDEDFRPIRRLVNDISKDGDFTVTVRSTWLVFSLFIRLQREKVIAFEQCWKIAEMCGIRNRDELKKALQYLHKNLGLVRFFPTKKLENIIIIDPQILFHKITTLITEIFLCQRPLHDG